MFTPEELEVVDDCLFELNSGLGDLDRLQVTTMGEDRIKQMWHYFYELKNLLEKKKKEAKEDGKQ